MKYELSMCLAGIRPHFWKRLYDSAVVSCSRYSWEMVVVSPYPLPEEMQGLDNVKYVYDKGCPTRASQHGTVPCEGKLLMFPCDDGVFIPDACNQAIDLWNVAANPKDGMVLRYKEGAGMNAPSFPLAYWNVRYHLGDPNLRVGNDWKIAPQPMLTLERYRELGGVDVASFECMSWATHDLCYRIQRDGGVFHLSPLEVMDADNYGATGVDHAPIFHAHGVDHAAFTNLYTNDGALSRVKINFDSWQSSPEVWARRWGTNG
jgi:hypothetical protein